ncbi:unnamed protein product [Paramecium octaurelia]|uniref:Tetratricopeptide repeat protein n=1 Tax=Paramecium octaurelia TaxID=43137 RepID=A0A8S1XK61_PAROT|nr:unnamed protein product [Paramecium octaurelia]
MRRNEINLINYQLLILRLKWKCLNANLKYLYIGFALNRLNKYQEAIECYDKAISINSKNDNAFCNKGLTLHNLKQYSNALVCYNQALSISIDPIRLKLKADSLFQLGMKLEAKETYLAALQQGSTEQEYIKKQLQKL